MRALILLSLLFIASTSYGQIAGKKEGKPKAEQQRGTEEAPFVVKASGPKTDSERQREHYESIEKPWVDRILLGATVILALFTALLFAATYSLARDAKATGTRQLRAYVGIRPHPKFAPVTLEEMHTTGLHFQIVNYGKTPAHKVGNVVAMGGWTEDSPDLPVDENPSRGSKFVLHPGASSDLEIKRKTAFSEVELASIRKGELKIFVWGKIWYQDAFGDDQWTTFRFRQDRNALHWTEEGNDAS